MAYDDWNHAANADTNHTLNESTVAEGNASLHVDDMSVESFEVYKQSVTDSPATGIIQSETYIPGMNGNPFMAYFRYQDTQNHYYAQAITQPDGQDKMKIGKVVDGTKTELLDILGAHASAWSATFLSGGNQATDNWIPWRVVYWTDTTGAFRIRLQEDADRDGTWTKLYNHDDAVDSSPSFTSGGAQAIGGNSGSLTAPNADPTNFDITELYY